MIDVKLNPIGRNLMTATLGVLKYKAMIQAKQVAELNKQVKNIEGMKKNIDVWNEISMDMTSRMLDKRYNDPTFKRSTSVEDRNLHRLTKQQALRSRVKLNSAVTQYNQRLSEKKIKTSFKAINIDQVL